MSLSPSTTGLVEQSLPPLPISFSETLAGMPSESSIGLAMHVACYEFANSLFDPWEHAPKRFRSKASLTRWEVVLM